MGKKKKKKKKKAKARSRSASSDSSDSDGDRNKKMEEELFSMVAELTSRKSKKSSRDSGEEVLIDLMKKMSESYSKIKKENSETSARCVILENQNKVLKRQVEDLQEKLEVMNSDGRESRKSDREREGPASKKSRFASEGSEKDEQKCSRYNQAPPAPVPVPVPAPVPPVMAPSGWGHEAEREQRYKEPDRHEERDRYRDDRPERYRDERTERYRDPREDRYRDDRVLGILVTIPLQQRVTIRDTRLLTPETQIGRRTGVPREKMRRRGVMTRKTAMKGRRRESKNPSLPTNGRSF